jgi:hypothetical protein
MPIVWFTPVLPFVLPGFAVEHVHTADTTLLIEARANTSEACCPDCHAACWIALSFQGLEPTGRTNVQYS